MKRILAFGLVLALIVASAPVVVAAEDKPPVDPADMPWDHVYFQFGGFLADMDTGFRLGSENLGIGIALSVEDFLGLKSSNTAFRLDGGWRFTKNYRHRLSFSWFNVNRKGENTLSKDLEIGDGIILEGTTIQSIFDFDLFKVKYAYSFLLDERIDLNVGGGLYVLPLEFGLGEKGKEFTQESVTAPLPVVTLGFNFALTEKWFLRQDIDFLFIKIQDVKGSVLDLSFALERRMSRHLALGLGVEILNLSVEATGDNSYPGLGSFDGEVGFGYTGLQLYLKGNF